MTSIRAYYCGLVGYNAALELQRSLVLLHKESAYLTKPQSNGNSSQPHPPNTILLLQHPPVYTIGIRQVDPTNDYSDTAAQRLTSLGAEFIRTNRGGLITFHGPGQLVAYPVVNLRSPGMERSVRWYVRALEASIIDVCSHFGVQASRTCDVGVWVEDRKIAAIGVHNSGSITSHGLALNCDLDLSWFTHIVPCGLIGRGVTSLSKESCRPITVADVVPIMADVLARNLNCQSVHFEDVSGSPLTEKLEVIQRTR